MRPRAHLRVGLRRAIALRRRVPPDMVAGVDPLAVMALVRGL